MMKCPVYIWAICFKRGALRRLPVEWEDHTAQDMEGPLRPTVSGPPPRKDCTALIGTAPPPRHQSKVDRWPSRTHLIHILSHQYCRFSILNLVKDEAGWDDWFTLQPIWDGCRWWWAPPCTHSPLSPTPTPLQSGPREVSTNWPLLAPRGGRVDRFMGLNWNPHTW